jgi:tRNA-splicing ligase RtcB (3'-phosphate/5'-hydroxy nucleic acid ligase)
MKIIKTDLMKVPAKSWCNNVEESALKQIQNLGSLPFIFKHVAIMPDCHAGYGMVIGGVLPTSGVVSPNCVGVDIGCGLCSIESNIQEWHKNDLIEVLKKIRFNIPVGFGRHLKPKDVSKLPSLEKNNFPIIGNYPYFEKFLEPSLYQLGTLGGGNHFIELQKNLKGNLCIMIHSGSRNIGKQVADYYNKLAKVMNEKYFSAVPKEWDLAFFPLDSDEGQDYLHEMEYCVQFALANRQEMMREVQEAIYTIFKPRGKVEFSNFINIPHNYARLENHFGRNVMVHRKGSTSAKKDELGLIPGSQGSKSYIVKGLGNIESFTSCSHGAGRKMGRNVARKTLDLKQETDKLNAMGVIHAVRNEKDLDEAPGSYKDINVVMEEQKDLVEIVDEFSPLAVIKA